MTVTLIYLQFDKSGIQHKVTYDCSFLVKAKLIKSESWGPFSKVGELTAEGIQFVENTIGELPVQTFDRYYRRNKLVK